MSAFAYWVGIDTDPTAGAADEAALDDYYAQVHLPEALRANPGFVTAARYRLESPDPRGDLGPTSLTMYEVADRAGAERYVAREHDPEAPRPTYTPGPALWKTKTSRWRVIWEHVGGVPAPAAQTLLLVGHDAAPAPLGPLGVTLLQRYEVFIPADPDGLPEYCTIHPGDELDELEGDDALPLRWSLRYRLVGSVLSSH